MRIFQGAVVALGAVMAVLDHHQMQQQKVSSPALERTVKTWGVERLSEVQGDVVRSREERVDRLEERSHAPEVVLHAALDPEEVVAKDVILVGTLSETVQVERLNPKAPVPLSQPVVSPFNVRLSAEPKNELSLSIDRKATHHSEVGFVSGSVGLFPSVRWRLNDPSFDPEKAGVSRGYTGKVSPPSQTTHLNRLTISLGCLSQSFAIQFSRRLTSRMDLGLVAGTSLGGFRTPDRGWDVSETFVVDAVGDFQWVGAVLNHRPFHLGGVGEHIRVQLGLYSGRNRMQLTSRNSGDVLEGSWRSRASVYLGMGGDLNLTDRMTLTADAGGLCVANPRINRGTPSQEMVDVANSVAETHLFAQCRLGLGWSF